MPLSPIHGLGGNTPTGPTPVGANAPTFSAPPPELPTGPGAQLPQPIQNYLGQYTRPAAPTPGASVPLMPPISAGGFNSIDTFPGVANARALEQQGFGQLDAQLNSQRQQAIINFGDPSLAQMAGFGLDPQAAAFAQQNYLSGNATMARLDKSHKLASQAVVNALAAHGLLGSGDLGYREGQENQAYGNNVYDAQQSVLSQLAGLYNNYLSSRYGLEENVNNAEMAALGAFMSDPNAYSTMFDSGGASTAPKVTPTTTNAATAASKALSTNAKKAATKATSLPSKRVTGGRI